MNRHLANAVVSIVLVGCAACASTPPRRFGEIAGHLEVAGGSSQLLVYALERAGVVVELDDRWIGYLVTDSSYACSFLFVDAAPGTHRVALRMDNATPSPDVDNVTPRDDMRIVLAPDQRLTLRVVSKRDLLFSSPQLVASDAGVPDRCVYVGPEDALAQRGMTP